MSSRYGSAGAGLGRREWGQPAAAPPPPRSFQPYSSSGGPRAYHSYADQPEYGTGAAGYRDYRPPPPRAASPPDYAAAPPRRRSSDGFVPTHPRPGSIHRDAADPPAPPARATPPADYASGGEAEFLSRSGDGSAASGRTRSRGSSAVSGASHPAAPAGADAEWADALRALRRARDVVQEQLDRIERAAEGYAAATASMAQTGSAPRGAGSEEACTGEVAAASMRAKKCLDLDDFEERAGEPEGLSRMKRTLRWWLTGELYDKLSRFQKLEWDAVPAYTRRLEREVERIVGKGRAPPGIVPVLMQTRSVSLYAPSLLAAVRRDDVRDACGLVADAGDGAFTESMITELTPEDAYANTDLLNPISDADNHLGSFFALQDDDAGPPPRHPQPPLTPMRDLLVQPPPRSAQQPPSRQQQRRPSVGSSQQFAGSAGAGGMRGLSTLDDSRADSGTPGAGRAPYGDAADAGGGDDSLDARQSRRDGGGAPQIDGRSPVPHRRSPGPTPTPAAGPSGGDGVERTPLPSAPPARRLLPADDDLLGTLQVPETVDGPETVDQHHTFETPRSSRASSQSLPSPPATGSFATPAAPGSTPAAAPADADAAPPLPPPAPPPDARGGRRRAPPGRGSRTPTPPPRETPPPAAARKAAERRATPVPETQKKEAGKGACGCCAVL